MTTLDTKPALSQPQPLPAASLGRTLESLEEAVRYRDWIFSAAAPHLGRRILEIGAGTGTMTQCVADRELVLALELDPAFAARLRDNFRSRPSVEVIETSATDRQLLMRVAASRIDSAMTFNVLEHIDDDQAVIDLVHDLLPPKGRFSCFVPAFPLLFGTMDRTIGHVRRYTREELAGKFRSAGFTVVEARYMNMIGFFLWFVNGRIMRSSGIVGGASSLRFHDRWILPVTRALERTRHPLFGQSLFIVGERRS